MGDPKQYDKADYYDWSKESDYGEFFSDIFLSFRHAPMFPQRGNTYDYHHNDDDRQNEEPAFRPGKKNHDTWKKEQPNENNAHGFPESEGSAHKKRCHYRQISSKRHGIFERPID